MLPSHLTLKILASRNALQNPERGNSLVGSNPQSSNFENKFANGELLLKTLETSTKDKVFNDLDSVLRNHFQAIPQIYLNEALVSSRKRKLAANINDLLINYGANKDLMRAETCNTGLRKFTKENPNFFRRSSNKWCQRDRVLSKFLLDELGNPEKKVPPVIHVTGSNGKGSVCALIQSMLQESGYVVHKYTNPYIIRNNENYVVSGKEIGDNYYYELICEVKEAYERVKNKPEYLKAVEEADKKDIAEGKNATSQKYNDVLYWSFSIPIAMLAFSRNLADFTIVEVVVGGLNDFTNVFSEKETISTLLTHIKYGIGSNDNCMPKPNALGVLEFNTTATAYHKAMLGKKGVPMIVANQEPDGLSEIRRVAKNIIKTKTIEYGRDWFINRSTPQNGEDENLVFSGLGYNLKLKKSKSFLDSFQMENIGIATACLLNLKNSNKINLSGEALQNGIDKAEIIARPQRILNGFYKDLFGPDTEIITGIIKFNAQGITPFEDMISKDPDCYNYFIYTSGSDKLTRKATHFVPFIKKCTDAGNSELIIYNHNQKIFDIIKHNLDLNSVKYNAQNYLSSALEYTKSRMDARKNKRNRVFILCDSMVNFDARIWFLNT
jgi:folylpolyglutamate synthase/dihydrofolate synthase